MISAKVYVYANNRQAKPNWLQDQKVKSRRRFATIVRLYCRRYVNQLNGIEVHRIMNRMHFIIVNPF